MEGITPEGTAAVSPILLTGLVIFFGVLPFAAIMMSSFVKIVVVVLLLKNALGIQQIPPSMAVNGLAIILSVYIMAPIGIEIYGIFQDLGIDFSSFNDPNLQIALSQSLEPIKEFLFKFSSETEREFFARSTQRLWPEELAETVSTESFLILLPAYTVSQLTSAFQIGFLIYLPFIVIDLVVSSILLAMGMSMVSPLTISLPFKLLLFVLADGWTRLLHGLVLSYQ